MDERLTGRQDQFTIPDWKIGPVSARPMQFAAVGMEFPGVVFELPARRSPGYYIWKVIVPLATVVFMSWTVFWIDPRQVAPQVGRSSGNRHGWKG